MSTVCVITTGQNPTRKTTDTIVSSVMPPAEIFALLARHSCSDITNQLDLEKCGCAPLDSGGFGDVYQGALNEGTLVAIKCPRLHFRLDDKKGHKLLKRTAHELYTWSRFDHDNIVKLLGVAQFRDRISMISPWMNNGTLLKYIERNPKVDRHKLCLEISQGVAYLHKENTIHGDIKSGNVLISEDGVAKLADFGCAELKESTVRFTATTSGSNFSMRWAAPEMLSGDESVIRSRETDVYALGMTLLEAVTGQIPFCNKDDMFIYNIVVVKKQAPERPKLFSSFKDNEVDQLWELMASMWAQNPSYRPEASIVRDELKDMRSAATPSRSAVSYSRAGRRVSRIHDNGDTRASGHRSEGSHSSQETQLDGPTTVTNSVGQWIEPDAPCLRERPLVYPVLLSQVAEGLHQRIPISERVKNGLTYPGAFDGYLVFEQGEEVDLRLEDEQQQLIACGPLKWRGGSARGDEDLEVFLLDHMLLVAKSVMVKNRKKLILFQPPIPLKLLLISQPEDNVAQSTGSPTTLTQHRLSGLTVVKGTPPAAPVQPSSPQDRYQFTVSKLGKHGYSLTLQASMSVMRQTWVKQIMAQQETIRKQNMVFDMFVLDEDTFVGDAKVNCAAPYGMGRRIVYGTNVGVYFQTLGEGENKTLVKVLELPSVQQIDVLEKYRLLIVLSEQSVLTFPLDEFESLNSTSLLKQMKRISSHTSFFKAGHCLDRTLVCIVKVNTSSSTIKIFELVSLDTNGKSELASKELQLFKKLRFPAAIHSVHFLKTKLCVACTQGFETIDLESLNTYVLLDPSRASLDFVRNWEDVRPVSVYRIDEMFLLCYNEFAFYIDECGRRSKLDAVLYWEGTPTAFALHYPYIIAFDPTFIEIRHVEDGALVQVIQGNNLRCLFANNQPPKTKFSSIQGSRQRYGRTEIITASDDKVMSLQLSPGPSLYV